MTQIWWLNRIADPNQPISLADLERAAKWIDRRVGYAYLIHMERTPYYKIGVSKDPTRRALTFASVALPVDFPLIHAIYTNDMLRLESDLHRRFAEKRQRGEWFTLIQDDVNTFRSIQAILFPEVLRASERIKAYERAVNFNLRSFLKQAETLPSDLKAALTAKLIEPLPLIPVEHTPIEECQSPAQLGLLGW